MAILFTDVATEVLAELGDPNENVWTKAEIIRYLDEGQLEIAEQTRYLRGRAPITTKEDMQIYNFPDDMLVPLRVEDKNGREIKPVTFAWLQAHCPGFRGRDATGSSGNPTGDPAYYYSDLAGDGRLEFYPHPDPSIEIGPVAATNYLMQLINISSASCLSMFVAWDRIYVLSDMYMTIYDSSFNRIKRITHGASPLQNFSITGDLDSICVADNIGSDYITPGTIYFSDGANFNQITNAGSVSTLGAAASKITAIFPLDRIYGAWVFFSTSNNTYLADVSLGFTATSIHAVRSYQVAHLNSNVYFACGSNGVKKRGNFDGNLTASTALSSENVAGIVDHNGTLYINHNGTLATMTAAGVITNSSYTGISTAGCLYSDGVYIYAYNTAQTSLLRIDVSSTPATDSTYGSQGVQVAYSVLTNNNVVFNQNLLSSSVNTVALTYTIMSTENDLGGVCFLDGEVFDSEYGEIVDIIDDEDPTKFTSEYGIITEIISDDDVAYVNYIRRPIEGQLEVPDARPLKEYAKHRAYDKRTDKESARLQAKHLGFFTAYKNKLGYRSATGFNNTAGAVKNYQR